MHAINLVFIKHINGIYNLNQYIDGMYMVCTWYIVSLSRCFYITGIYSVQIKWVCSGEFGPKLLDTAEILGACLDATGLNSHPPNRLRVESVLDTRMS
jgi:hypothetical protein